MLLVELRGGWSSTITGGAPILADVSASRDGRHQRGQLSLQRGAFAAIAQRHLEREAYRRVAMAIRDEGTIG